MAISPIPLEDHVGDILQKARAGRGLSLANLAVAVGIREAELRQIEDLNRQPSCDELHRLADSLELSTEKLSVIAEGAWSPREPPPELEAQVLCIRGSIGGYPVNGYILYDRESRTAACADTAFAPDKMLQALHANHLDLKYILLTHCHRDHMGGVERLKDQTGASVLLHRNELPLFRSQSRTNPDGFVDEETRLALGALQIGILDTPGHTPGGATYIVQTPNTSNLNPGFRPLCFVGDALFAGSTGRSMSPQGYRSLLASLSQKVLSLPDETLIFPGHGPLTTVGEEKRHNPFF